MKKEPSTFAERLKWSLEQHPDMDQSKLARAVGVEPQTIQYLASKGQRSGHTTQIAAALGVDATWLSTGKGEPYSHKNSGKVRINAQLLEDIADLVDAELTDKKIRISKTLRFHWIADLYEEAVELFPHYQSEDKDKIHPLFNQTTYRR